MSPVARMLRATRAHAPRALRHTVQRAWRVARVLGVLGVLGGSAAPASLRAQSSELTLSTGALIIPSPTIAHLTSWPPSATGPVSDSAAVTWQLSGQRGLLRGSQITVFVRCEYVTSSKPCSDVEWRDATGNWRALSSVGEIVDTRLIPQGGGNGGSTNYGGSVWVRYRLRWSDPAPATYLASVAFDLEVRR